MGHANPRCRCDFFEVAGEKGDATVRCISCGEPPDPSERIAAICDDCDYCAFPWENVWDDGHPAVCPECFGDLVLVRESHPEAVLPIYNSPWGHLQRLLRQAEDRASENNRPPDSPPGKPKTRIRKHIPGDHYHVLETKFATFEQALAHLNDQGFAYDGFELLNTQTLCINRNDGRGWVPVERKPERPCP